MTRSKAYLRFDWLVESLLLTVLSLSLACGEDSTSTAVDANAEPVFAPLTVITEEVVTRFSAADNGAGPLWAYGSTNIIRDGDAVYVSIIETGKDVPPLCNTRWQIWKRGDVGSEAETRKTENRDTETSDQNTLEADAWRIVASEREYRQREPCPIVRLGGGELLLSANPSITAPGTRYRACLPTVFSILGRSRLAIRSEMPVWFEPANFNDHSYRGFAADAVRGEALLLNIDKDTSAQHVSYRDPKGRWHARGKIEFPIRAAYPQVGLRDGSAHVMAIGDIREPNAEWQQLKRQVLKREWDYVFRRLFYTVTPDITRLRFAEPVEIDSVESTGGHILNLDMHIDAAGKVHLLYLKKPHQHAFLRDKYFPGARLIAKLEYVVLNQGRIVSRESIAQTPSDQAETQATPTLADGLEPSFAKFHIAKNGRLFAVVAGTQIEAGKPSSFVNVIVGLNPKQPERLLLLQHPFRRFFTSTPRAGAEPSDLIDIFGTADDVPNLRYAQLKVPPP